MTTFIGLIVIASVQAPAGYDFAWKPVKGEALTYDFFVEGKDATTNGSVEAGIERKVVEVKKDGSYVIVSRVLGSIVRIGGHEVKDETTHESRATFDARGRLKSLNGEMGGAEQFRHALLTQFVRPEASVEVNGTWRFESSGIKADGLGKVTVKYTLDSVEGGLATIKFQFVETEIADGQKASGTWLIDTKTGSPISMEAKVLNYVGTSGATANVRLVRRLAATAIGHS